MKKETRSICCTIKANSPYGRQHDQPKITVTILRENVTAKASASTPRSNLKRESVSKDTIDTPFGSVEMEYYQRFVNKIEKKEGRAL
jgi:hypothetical protein